MEIQVTLCKLWLQKPQLILNGFLKNIILKRIYGKLGEMVGIDMSLVNLKMKVKP